MLAALSQNIANQIVEVKHVDSQKLQPKSGYTKVVGRLAAKAGEEEKSILRRWRIG